MPDNYQQQFEEDRSRQAQRSERDKTRQAQQTEGDRARQTESSERPIAPPEPASFPWEMLCLAALFDLIGLIPIINLFTETLAGLIFGWWQKGYNPKLDPILTFIVTKIIDVVSLGILPSNIGIVVYSYIKKKAAAQVYDAMKNPGGLAMANKMLKNQQI